MKIVGEKLLLPRNFEFFRRLPSRFEILVVGKGAVRPEGSAFEVEILGQRLTLKSIVDLKPGARYELEKQSAMEFRIVRETERDSNDAKAATQLKRSDAVPANEDQGATLYFEGALTSAADLWKIQNLADSGLAVEEQGQKYRFDFETAAGLKGLFVPVSSGGFSLLVCGAAATTENTTLFQEILGDLQIRSVARIDSATFERIAGGAIDFSG